MAYGNIYWAGFKSKGVTGTLYIDKIDYTGPTSKLVLVEGGLEINYKFGGWEDPVIPLQCSFSILNTKEDFFELLPLMFSEEREYKVRVVMFTPVAYTAFDGYINCEPVTQKYLHKQIIDLVASNYLMKLKSVHPTSIDTLQNKTFIDVINEILKSTGSTFPIRVNAQIHAEGDTPSAGQTLFNMNGFFTELFWEDNVERVASLDILTRILKPFNCYIYWWQNYWYIERYEDLWNTSINYVEYSATETYSPTEAGTVVNKTFVITDLNQNTFVERSQELGGTPGLKTLCINLMDQRYLNLVNIQQRQVDFATTDFPIPNFRECLIWQKLSTVWTPYWVPKNDILYALQRHILILFTEPVEPHRGIYFNFKSTIVSKEDQLSVSFKYCLEKISWMTSIEDYNYKFHWYIRVLPDHDYLENAEDNWYLLNADTEPSWVQSIEIKGSEFDKDTNTISVSFNIPIGKINDYRVAANKGYLRGDQSFVLCIGEEKIVYTDDNGESIEGTEFQPNMAWFGDVSVTSTGADQNNVIEGTTNTRYLDRLDVDLDLYDVETFNYKNAILRGTVLEKRTERWGTTGGISEITEKGICWSSVNTVPTLADSFSVDGTGFGAFESQLVDLTPNTLYYYRAYATNALGTTVYGDVKSFTSEQLKVGHKYQGGIIGHIFTEDEAGYVVGEVHGIIVSVQDIDTRVVWGRLSGGGPYVCAAYGQEIGDGVANTAAIEANTFQNDFAIRKIVDYVNEGYTDWFLPSLNELFAIGINKTVLGMASDWYWSSSENEKSWKKAYAVDMKYPMPRPDYWDKHNYMRTRACRNF